MKIPNPHKTKRLTRFIASAMLVLLFPAMVFAAPLRYCIDQIGHRAIEFVHGKGISHEDSETQVVRPLESPSAEHHTERPSCQDKLLLPVGAKPDSCGPSPPRYPNAIAAEYRFKNPGRAKLRPHLKWRPAVVYTPRRDQRLVTLRTVVLLN